jgi:hypothetical protein
MQKTQTYLVHFFKKFKFYEFALPELESLASMYGTDLKTMYSDLM